MLKENLPPHVTANDKVILFDGVCKLCHGWARFLIKYDKKRVFKLATVQSKHGQAILKYFDRSIDEFNTMLLIDGNIAYDKSNAFFQVIKKLPYRFRLIMIFAIIPRPIKDWLYDRIALNRYKLFGQFDHCLLPSPDHKSRFLK